jgi:pimeloyl-ACP methyl ester carboxylesterase
MPKDRARKAYADTPFGQVHYRSAGPADAPALLLIHWTPLSGRMYAALLPLLAERGFRVIAPDLLGYGRSVPRPETWSIAAWADSLLALLDGLGIGDAVVLGGHVGACVAVEIALAQPERVRRLILDGCPLPTPELRAAFASMKAQARPQAAPDGAHERLAFQAAAGLLKHYTPSFTLEGAGLERVWPAMIDYLETDFVSSAPISGAYDLGERLPLVTTPLLLMGAATDTLAGSFDAARALAPAARTAWFEGDHPIHDPAEAEAYISAWSAFAAEG